MSAGSSELLFLLRGAVVSGVCRVSLHGCALNAQGCAVRSFLEALIKACRYLIPQPGRQHAVRPSTLLLHCGLWLCGIFSPAPLRQRSAANPQEGTASWCLCFYCCSFWGCPREVCALQCDWDGGAGTVCLDFCLYDIIGTSLWWV